LRILGFEIVLCMIWVNSLSDCCNFEHSLNCDYWQTKLKTMKREILCCCRFLKMTSFSISPNKSRFLTSSSYIYDWKNKRGGRWHVQGSQTGPCCKANASWFHSQRQVCIDHLCFVLCLWSSLLWASLEACAVVKLTIEYLLSTITHIHSFSFSNSVILSRSYFHIWPTWFTF